MVITKRYAKRLIKMGKAKAEGIMKKSNGEEFMILTRFDLQRTDHYKI